MDISRFKQIYGGNKGEPMDHTLEMLVWLTRSQADSYKIPALFSAKGFTVRLGGSFVQRVESFNSQEVKRKSIDQSQRAAFTTLTRRVHQYDDGARTAWGRALRVEKDSDAETLLIGHRESEIRKALENRDGQRFIDFGKELEKLRRARREKKGQVVMPPLLAFIVVNWNEGWSVDAGAGRTVFFPPLCFFSNPALAKLAAALGMAGFNNKLITRTFKLARELPSLVRSLNITGKIVTLC